MSEERKKSSALRISLIAITTAIVAVFTIAIRVPTPVGGYVSLCDVAVVFVSATFGPVTGFIAGGVGTAIADLAGGFGQWAPEPDSLVYKLLAAAVAILTVAGGYFLLTGAFLIGFAAALPEVPANVVQSACGVIVGLPLSVAVRKAYRRIDEFKW